MSKICENWEEKFWFNNGEREKHERRTLKEKVLPEVLVFQIFLPESPTLISWNQEQMTFLSFLCKKKNQKTKFWIFTMSKTTMRKILRFIFVFSSRSPRKNDFTFFSDISFRDVYIQAIHCRFDVIKPGISSINNIQSKVPELKRHLSWNGRSHGESKGQILLAIFWLMRVLPMQLVTVST